MAMYYVVPDNVVFPRQIEQPVVKTSSIGHAMDQAVELSDAIKKPVRVYKLVEVFNTQTIGEF